MQNNQTVSHAPSGSLATTNKVLRNTYLLLGMSLAISAGMAMVSMRFNLPRFGLLPTLIGYFGLLFAISKFRNSDFSILLVFALTGFMGMTLGPMLNAYLSLPNGSELVALALGTTAVTFISLSAFVIVSGKNFSFMGAFLGIGILAAFVAGLIGYFMGLPNVMLAVSGAFVLLMVGLILYETSQIVHGGETNYVMATVTLYVSIFNLFTSLLHLFGVMGDD